VRLVLVKMENNYCGSKVVFVVSQIQVSRVSKIGLGLVTSLGLGLRVSVIAAAVTSLVYHRNSHFR